MAAAKLTITVHVRWWVRPLLFIAHVALFARLWRPSQQQGEAFIAWVAEHGLQVGSPRAYRKAG